MSRALVEINVSSNVKNKDAESINSPKPKT